MSSADPFDNFWEEFDASSEELRDLDGNRFRLETITSCYEAIALGNGPNGEVLIIDNVSQVLQHQKPSIIRITGGASTVIEKFSDWEQVRVEFVHGHGRILVSGRRNVTVGHQEIETGLVKLYRINGDSLGQPDFEAAKEAGGEGPSLGFAALDVDEFVSLEKGKLIYLGKVPAGYKDGEFRFGEVEAAVELSEGDVENNIFELPRSAEGGKISAAFVKEGVKWLVVTTTKKRGTTHNLLTLVDGKARLQKIFPLSNANLFKADSDGRFLAGVEFANASRGIRLQVVSTDYPAPVLDVPFEEGLRCTGLAMSPNGSAVCVALSSKSRETTRLRAFNISHAVEKREVKHELNLEVEGLVRDVVFDTDTSILVARGSHPTIVERISF